MRNPLPPGFALSHKLNLNMSGVPKGKDGKTPSEKNSEDPKCEGKGARPKEFKNLEKKRKKKRKAPSVHVSGQSEAQSDNFNPQVLRRPRTMFESSEDSKHTVVHPERMDMTEARGKETNPQVPISNIAKMTLDPETTRRITERISPRKLWTNPDSKPADDIIVSPKSKKGGFAESQEMDLTEAKGQETKPQVPISPPSSKMYVDPEAPRPKAEVISPGKKLWTDPDRIPSKRKEKSCESHPSEPLVPIPKGPKIWVDSEELRTRTEVRSPGKTLWMDPDRYKRNEFERKSPRKDDKQAFKRNPEDKSPKKRD